jgi:hypothetical protein
MIVNFNTYLLSKYSKLSGAESIISYLPVLLYISKGDYSGRLVHLVYLPQGDVEFSISKNMALTGRGFVFSNFVR